MSGVDAGREDRGLVLGRHLVEDAHPGQAELEIGRRNFLKVRTIFISGLCHYVDRPFISYVSAAGMLQTRDLQGQNGAKK